MCLLLSCDVFIYYYVAFVDSCVFFLAGTTIYYLLTFSLVFFIPDNFGGEHGCSIRGVGSGATIALP